MATACSIRPRRVTLVIVLAIASSTAAAHVAAAPTYIVNSSADVIAAAPLDSGPCETAPGNGVCTLRAALMKANHFPGGGATIRFAPGLGPCVLSISGPAGEAAGDLDITASMTIIGNGVSSTVIDGNGTVTGFNVLTIDKGAGAVSISALTIRNGRASTLAAGINNSATLTLEDVVMTDNESASVGGIVNDGTATIVRSAIVNNRSTADTAGGGGVYNYETMTIVDSIIRDNVMLGNPSRGGGVVTAFSAQTTIVGTTIAGNVAQDGGGVFAGGSGTMTIVNSTISGNVAKGSGGGLLAAGGVLTLFNSTVANNLANADGVGAASHGGGIDNNAGADVRLRNSIVAYNGRLVEIDRNGTTEYRTNECFGALLGLAANMVRVDDADCSIVGAVTYADPLLGPLQLNGGFTPTHALGATSPAIGAGGADGCTDPLGAKLASDQRGVSRPYPAGVGGVCDLGAFEWARVLDVDDSFPVQTYDAPTDGLLLLRYMFGLAGTPLAAQATSASARRADGTAVKDYLDANRKVLDVDRNGLVDPLTDGLLLVRRLFSGSGAGLTQGAVGANATLVTPTEIADVIDALRP